MRYRASVLFAVGIIVVLATPSGWATLIVDPSQPITRRVTVQLIQTALDNGSAAATVFGDATQRAYIEAGIDQIWAQAGIDVLILPAIKPYSSTFAYQGNAGSGTRPQGDLNTILSNAAAAGGILHSDPLTLNLFLVNVVPGFAPLSEDYAAGLALRPGNGITGFVGDNLLTFANGRDVISSVFAHEIGHNLGLDHTGAGTANLMSSGNGTSQQLTSVQVISARNSNFVRTFATPISGDYNGNGTVDAADYVLWRNTLSQSGSNLAADGNGNGTVESVDYIVWRTRLGLSTGSAAAAGVGSSLGGEVLVVPEPTTVVMLGVASAVWVGRRRSRSSR